VLPRRADPLLLAAVGAQWLVALLVAVLAAHAGWVYGDPAAAARVVGAASAVGHGDLPGSGAGFGWPLALAPLVRITGSGLGSALPPIVVLNVVVLGPILVASILELGTRLGGRLAGAVACAVWIAAPIVALPLFLGDYRDTALDAILPALVGLTATPYYPAAVALSAAAALTLRSVARDDRNTAIIAGAVAAFAGLITAPALGFAIAAAVALAFASRWQGLGAFAVGLAPGLVALAIWRHRELGEITISLGPIGSEALGDTMAALREYFWSNRLLQYLPLAGAIALFRLSRPGAVLLAGWVGAYVVTTAASSSPAVDFDGGGFFVAFLPALPAYLVLVAAIPLLVPTLQARLGQRLVPPAPRYRPGVRTLTVTLVVLGLVPLVASLALTAP
jgi:hypothetical protein